MWKTVLVAIVVAGSCWAWSLPPSTLNLWHYFTKPVIAGLGGLVMLWAIAEDLFITRLKTELKETICEVLKETKRNGVESNVKR